jgi:hypothetical protein
MMATMTDMLREIEKAHEAKYKLDQELRFKVECRRNKLFGLWVAGQIGLADDAAIRYARSLVGFGLEHPGVEPLIGHVKEDLNRHGSELSDRALHEAFLHSLEQSSAQIMNEYPEALDRDHVQIGG